MNRIFCCRVSLKQSPINKRRKRRNKRKLLISHNQLANNRKQMKLKLQLSRNSKRVRRQRSIKNHRIRRLKMNQTNRLLLLHRSINKNKLLREQYLPYHHKVSSNRRMKVFVVSYVIITSTMEILSKWLVVLHRGWF